MKHLFGTDGVRGRANHSPMTVENALALGRAFGKYLRSQSRDNSHKRVVIGKDTRLSCYIFENALIAGLCSMGIDTLMVGPLPTPGVAFITRAYRADAGIVISASHNPYHDNGIKFFTADGYKLPRSIEKEIEQSVYENQFEDTLPPDEAIGKNTKIDDADGRYIEFVKATLPKRLSLKGLNVVLDCAHGAGYRVAPLALRELDAQVNAYGNQPDGLNINRDCGALHLELARKAVLEHGADVGIAFDGDADRVIMIDEKAQVVDGDVILAICAYDMLQRGQLHNSKVVATVMSNYGFLNCMESLGIEVIQAQVGDRYVIQEMLKHQTNLGGEQSGHLILLDHNTTGDGLVAALQVLRIMIETDSKLSDLASIMKPYPQIMVNVKVAQKPPIQDVKGLIHAIEHAEKSLAKKGRVLVRYSGTENVCRIMVEGPQHKMSLEIANQIADVVNKEIGTD